MTEQQAVSWYVAECRTGSLITNLVPLWSELPEARREEIRRRVEDVLRGEVRRSEMSLGDLAVYFGRYRLLETAPPDKFSKDRASRRMVLYDSLEFGGVVPARNSTRLFGNANIGDYNRTNLEVPGQLASDQSFYIAGWHVVASDDSELLPHLERMLVDGMATLWLGDRPQTMRKLVELWREPCPVEQILPIRQTFNVVVDFFGRAFNEFCKRVDELRRDQEREPFRIWINLEGWQLREIY
jgi:hypothetical protein